jgi:hypothetical protein
MEHRAALLSTEFGAKNNWYAHALCVQSRDCPGMVNSYQALIFPWYPIVKLDFNFWPRCKILWQTALRMMERQANNILLLQPDEVDSGAGTINQLYRSLTRERLYEQS